MLKMKLLLSSIFFFTFLLGLTAAGQESIQLLKLDEKIFGGFSPASSRSDLPVAVSVTDAELREVSSSVLMAESWLRTYVLARYPSTKITTIVVGNSAVCSKNKNKENELSFVLLSLKNLFYSLTRWGLEKQIKVSTFWSSDCFHQNALQREESAENMFQLVVEFIHSTNSTFTLKLAGAGDVSSLSDETVSLISSHLDSMKKIGFLEFSKVNVIASVPRERNPTSRKLSFMAANLGDDEYGGESPDLFPGIAAGPPLPSDIAKHPHPPQSQIASPPQFGFAAAPELPPSVVPPPQFGFAAAPELPPSVVPPPQFGFAAAPELPPFVVPASPPLGFALPPCNPNGYAGAPIPQTGGMQKLWCVAKPSVPADMLQQAMDYACGDGGADCREITADGSCYNPDTLVAHASYAFNSYWQKNKRSGGTCSFGGTAMIISSDPSFLHCRFVLS